MSNTEQSYDGALISELGVKRYLKATKDIKTSNINFLLKGPAAQKAWKECNFGCHGPTYRTLQRPSTKGEFFRSLDNISPLLSGAVDGVQYQTIGLVERVGGGVNRTLEGLNATGIQNFLNVGDENTAAYDFAVTSFQKVLSFEIDVIDNPISQIVMAIVSDYITAIPEWVIEEALKNGAFKLPEKIDTAWILKALAMGVVDNIDKNSVTKAAQMLNKPVQHIVGKQIGKKLAVAIALIIASAITKRLLVKSVEIPSLKRNLVRIRKFGRTMKGGLGKTFISLLNVQGQLDKAARSSRNLQNNCPTLWNKLRFKLHGANMAYFLIEDVVGEYVDRLSLLEQNPKEFAKVMEALIKSKETTKIFFPGSL